MFAANPGACEKYGAKEEVAVIKESQITAVISTDSLGNIKKIHDNPSHCGRVWIQN